MPFRKAREIFLGRQHDICRDPKYCPQNIWMSTVGRPPWNSSISSVALDQLIDFLLVILNDFNIVTDLDKLFKHITSLRSPNRLRDKILESKSKSMGLSDKVQKVAARRLGSQTAIASICSSNPQSFIGDLLDIVDGDKIELPPTVREFYEALFALSGWYVGVPLFS